MDEKDVEIGTACMKDIVRVGFSSIHGPSWQVFAVPQKNIIVPNRMPTLGDN